MRRSVSLSLKGRATTLTLGRRQASALMGLGFQGESPAFKIIKAWRAREALPAPLRPSLPRAALVKKSHGSNVSGNHILVGATSRRKLTCRPYDLGAVMGKLRACVQRKTIVAFLQMPG